MGFLQVFDSKHMAELVGGFADTSLDKMVECCAATVSVAPEFAFTASYHDAAFDALCTARVFIALHNRLQQRDADATFSPVELRSQPFCNRVHVTQSDYRVRWCGCVCVRRTALSVSGAVRAPRWAR